MYIDTLFNEHSNTCVLDIQYRMSNEIGSLISELFYNGNIKNGRNEDVENSLTWIAYNPSKQWPIYQEEQDKLKIYNDDECVIVNKLLEKIIDKEGSDTTVAIIAPYRAQINSLRRSCIKSDNISIDTIDGFQGKESDIVIFSITRTTGSYRFLAGERRLNVALSRARNKIYIIGDRNYASKSPLLERVMNRCCLKEAN